MDFEDRLREAIARGERRHAARERDAAARAMSEAEIKQLHTKHRLRLSDHIEKSIHGLMDHFPGFRFETLYGDRGWGAACARDDLRFASGVRREVFSRLEITVRPYTNLQVLELNSRGTIANREVFNRQYFEKVVEADVEEFERLIDAWVLDYAELFAAAG
jgi:hypothetical protein